jgi:hypothetical protein
MQWALVIQEMFLLATHNLSIRINIFWILPQSPKPQTINKPQHARTYDIKRKISVLNQWTWKRQKDKYKEQEQTEIM